MTDGFDPLEGLTQRQRLGLQELMAAVDQTHSWSWNMPVLIRQRCWLRLDCISLGQLQRWLPPDAREEAPELVYFRKLRADGMSEVEAEQTCWQEFGMDSCQQALHRYWDSRDASTSPWTSHHFVELVTLYRRSFEVGQTRIPMLVLPRIDSVTGHQLHWLSISPPPMRHTCR